MRNNNDFFGFLAYEKTQNPDTDSLRNSNGSGCGIIIFVAIIIYYIIKFFM